MGKDIFYFSRADRIATGILLLVTVVTTVLRVHLPDSRPDQAIPTDSVAFELQDRPAVKPDTVYQARPEKRTYVSDRGKQYSSADRQKRQYTARDSVARDTVVAPYPRYPVKHRPSSPLDINAADSLDLILLPGIGKYYASRIVSYRKQLGGYVSVGQLSEIDGLPDSVQQWFTVTDTVPVDRMPVNELTLTQLRRHPYMNFYQAKAITELRREKGKVKSSDQLSLLEEFSGQDLMRLEPYLDFR